MGRTGILMAAGWKNPTRDLGFCPGFGFWLQKTCLESPRCKGGYFLYMSLFFSWSVWLLLGLNIYKLSDKALKSHSSVGAG